MTYEFDDANRFEMTIIHFDIFVVQIKFSNHAATHFEYIKNLRTFVDKCTILIEIKAEVSIVEKLNLHNESMIQTIIEISIFDERFIYYKKKNIEKNEFDEIHLIFKTRDEFVFVIKTFKSSFNKKKRKKELFV